VRPSHHELPRLVVEAILIHQGEALCDPRFDLDDGHRFALTRSHRNGLRFRHATGAARGGEGDGDDQHLHAAIHRCTWNTDARAILGYLFVAAFFFVAFFYLQAP